MIRPLAAALLVLTTAGFTACQRKPVIPQPPTAPPSAQCDATCFTPCTAADIRLHLPPRPGAATAHGHPLADTDAAFDELHEQVVLPLRARIDTCDEYRQACAQCLIRLDRARVIRLDRGGE